MRFEMRSILTIDSFRFWVIQYLQWIEWSKCKWWLVEETTEWNGEYLKIKKINELGRTSHIMVNKGMMPKEFKRQQNNNSK